MRVFLVFVAALLAACSGATYNATTVGYELHSPPAFLSANTHSEERMERTKLGIPLDIAVTHFGASRDLLFGGAGETYLAIAMHGAFQLPLEDATITVLDQALSQQLAPFGLAVTGRQKLAPTPLAVGEELTFTPSPTAAIKRNIHVRVYAAMHSVYFLLQAVDADARANVFTTRRQAFFDGFHVTLSATPAQAPALPVEKLALLAELFGTVVSNRNAE